MRGESERARRRGLGSALATMAVLLAVLGASAGLLWYRFSASGPSPKSGARATKAPAPPNGRLGHLVGRGNLGGGIAAGQVGGWHDNARSTVGIGLGR